MRQHFAFHFMRPALCDAKQIHYKKRKPLTTILHDPDGKILSVILTNPIQQSRKGINEFYPRKARLIGHLQINVINRQKEKNRVIRKSI